MQNRNRIEIYDKPIELKILGIFYSLQPYQLNSLLLTCKFHINLKNSILDKFANFYLYV